MIELRAIKKKLRPEYLRSLGQVQFWRHLHRRLVVRYLDRERPERFPVKVQIEATSKCNLRCPSCSRSREKHQGQDLTPDGLRKTLDRLPRRPAKVTLSGIGEPLVNPQFFGLVDTLAECGIRCIFYTNGTLLTRRIREAILSRRNIEAVNISCDGAHKGTFENLRRGADFESWKRSVRQLLVEAKRERPHTLSIGVRTVLSKQNLHEIREVIRLVAGLGFDAIGILDPIPIDDITASMCLSQAEFSSIREEDLRELSRSLGLTFQCMFRRDAASHPLFHLRCMQPWEYMFVRADGNVAPCCAVFGSDTSAVMGNIHQQGFLEIWHGDRFRQFRRATVLGTNALCRVCPYY